MDTSRIRRGAILKCFFPYDDEPAKPGPSHHYCLVIEAFRHEGMEWVIVAYGTSRLDEALCRAHPNSFDIRPDCVLGSKLTAPVTHILCSRVAAFPLTENWVDKTFFARLNLNPKHAADRSLQRLRSDYDTATRHLDAAARRRLQHLVLTKQPGMTAGAALRHG